MFTDNPLRDRITKYMYIGKNDSDPAFIIEDTFIKLLACRETREKIRSAVKDSDIDANLDVAGQAKAAVAAELCTAEEAEAFVAAEQARQRAIQVDDYPPEFFE
jgi:acyl-CoA dehydrogenase